MEPRTVGEWVSLGEARVRDNYKMRWSNKAKTVSEATQYLIKKKYPGWPHSNKPAYLPCAVTASYLLVGIVRQSSSGKGANNHAIGKGLGESCFK